MSVISNQNLTNIETLQLIGSGVPTAAAPMITFDSPESQGKYANGTLVYKDKDNNFVNSSGQIVNSNGDPLYISQQPYKDDPYNLPSGTEVYWGYRPGGDPTYQGWRFYTNSGNAPATRGREDFLPQMGHLEENKTVVVIPVYQDSANLPETPNQETYLNGQPKFTDSLGHSVNSSGFVVDQNGDVIRTYEHAPVMADNANYPDNTLYPITITPVYRSSSLDKGTYPNGTPTYKDGQGRPVNSSGQLVDAQGRPLYWDTPASGSPDTVPHEAFFDPDTGNFYYANKPDRNSGEKDTHTPMMGDGTTTLVNPNLKIETYSHGDQKYVDKNGKAVNSSGQLVDPETGDPVSRQSDAGVAWGTGPFTPVLVPIMNPDKPEPLYDANAPKEWLVPVAFAGSDVYSKSTLWLGALINDDASNNNNAIGFLLYTSNLAADGRFGDKSGNDFSEGLLSIQNSTGKTLVAESVDITMEQMVLNGGYTSQEAQEAINNLFSGEDPVSVAARAEATAEYNKMNPPAGQTYTPPTQLEIEKEWASFITDSTTQSTIKGAKSSLMAATIDGCHNNVYLAIVALLIVLEALGICKLTLQGNLSDNLSLGADDLNQIITEWEKAMKKDSAGFEDAASAQAWMNELKDLQAEMNEMPFDEETMNSINLQFDTIFSQQAMAPTYIGYHDSKGNPVTQDGQAVNADGYPLFERENTDENNGATVYKKNGTYYIDGSNPPQQASTNAAAIKPLYWTDDSSAWGGLTDGSGNTMWGRPNPSSTIPGITPTADNTLLYVNKSQQNVFKVSASGEAPSGATVYSSSYYGNYYYGNDGYVVFCNPPPNTELFTIGDQAFHGNDYYYCDVSVVGNDGVPSNLTYKHRTQGSSSNLQTSLNTFRPQDIDFPSPSAGGECEQYRKINDALNALVAPFDSQSAEVGTKMQQITANIEKVDNAIKEDTDNLDKVSKTINGNIGKA